jgi:hypothetical protein
MGSPSVRYLDYLGSEIGKLLASEDRINRCVTTFCHEAKYNPVLGMLSDLELHKTLASKLGYVSVS